MESPVLNLHFTPWLFPKVKANYFNDKSRTFLITAAIRIDLTGYNRIPV